MILQGPTRTGGGCSVRCTAAGTPACRRALHNYDGRSFLNGKSGNCITSLGRLVMAGEDIIIKIKSRDIAILFTFTVFESIFSIYN